jgi:large subunit ribosomal protein L6
MSRIGRSPIPVPNGVSITLSDGHVSVKGPQGTLERDLPGQITVRQDGDVLVVERPDDARQNRALHGLTRSLVANMVTGVSTGFTKELEIVGVGYRAVAQGPDRLEKELVGQVAANIRKIRKPEPYKGKGVRYAGEVVLRKAGKAAK